MPRTHRNTRRYHNIGIPSFSIFYGPLREVLTPIRYWTENLETRINELCLSQREMERELESLRWARGTFPQTRELELERTDLRRRIEAIRYLLRELSALVPRLSRRRNSF
jgi:hypothetical protein